MKERAPSNDLRLFGLLNSDPGKSKLMRIGFALVVGFVTAAMLIGILGSATYAGVTAASERRTWANESITPKVNALQDMKSAAALLALATDKYVFTPKDIVIGTPETDYLQENVREHAMDEIQSRQKDIQTSFGIYSQIVDEKFAVESGSRDSIASKLSGFIEADNDLIRTRDQLDEGNSSNPLNHPQLLAAHSRFLQTEEDLLKNLDGQVVIDRGESLKIRDSVTTELSQLVSATAIFTTASAALVGLSGYLIYRSFGIPLKKLKVGVDKIAKGDFNVEIEEDGRNDEVGSLARAIDAMQKELHLREGQKDEFISIASHELRTPIQPILGYAMLAKLGRISSEKAWDAVLGEARRLQRLTNDILDVTKIGSNTLEYHPEAIIIHEQLQNIIHSASLGLKAGVSIFFDFDESKKDVSIEADRSRITQVFTNIIENAKKFTDQGEIRIKCEVLTNEGVVKITFTDCGRGIPNEIMPVLFKKFATKSHGQASGVGTGLGLYISKAIVNAHGGEITARNNVSREGNTLGACFEITLPLKNDEKNAAFAPKHKSKDDLVVNNAATT